MPKKKSSKNKTQKPVINSKQEVKKPPKWFYLILFFIPVLFFVLLEIGLRIADYGTDFTQFKVISDYYPDKIFLNPDLPYKYFFNLKSAPSVIPDGFDKIKKDNAFRVFVLGGSSAAGWPYVPNAAFSRQLKRRLELLYPENTIEVINLGVSAINSYTIRDFVPGVIEQKPDLILIYTGHNEYYGAFGAGSSVFLTNSRFFVNTFIWLQNFKTTLLIQDFISWFYGFFISEKKYIEEKSDGTLMSRMIGESLIPFNSDTFWSGINQFEGNLRDILERFSEEKIPVILGTLTMNLRDQKPFVSVENENYPPADEVYADAQRQLELGNIEEAQQLFFQAKEFDALRFRAPEKINDVIRKSGSEFNFSVIDIDSAFKVNSPLGIVGYNLTVDHLHPNIEGYRLIADVYFDEMEKLNLLPKGKRIDIVRTKADSILTADLPLTKLDSTLAELSIMVLTGAYPFVPQGTPNYKILNFKMNDKVDSLAAAVFDKVMKWENAHAKMAEYFYNAGDYKNFMREMDAIIAERPFFDVPYENVVTGLIQRNLYNESIPYLKKLHSFCPSYFTNKWLGQVYLSLNESEQALTYLSSAVKYPEADYQVWYNLSGAYFLTGNINSSIASIERSLQLNSKNPAAQNFYNQLKSLRK